MPDEEYKVVGELTDEQGAGVYGHNRATSGEAVGIAGKTDSPEGYGLYTPDDAAVHSVLTAGAVDTAALNGVGTPHPDDNGQGIRDALREYDTVLLRPGVYELEQQIVLGETKMIAGSGHRRGKTVLEVTSDIGETAVMRGVGGQFDIPHLRDFEIDANHNAAHCLEVPDSHTDFVLKQLQLHNARKDGLRCIGSFNGLIEKCRIRNNGRDGIVFGDTRDTDDGDNDFRSSSIHVHKCHIGPTPEKGINIGGKREANTAVPNILVTHSDLKGTTSASEQPKAEVGVYFGRYGSDGTVLQADVEKNVTGIQIGDSTLPADKPYRINVIGGKWSGNETNIDVQSGVHVTLIGLGGSGSTDGLVIGSNVRGNVVEQRVNFDGPTTRNTETRSMAGEPGTKVTPYRTDMTSQDLSAQNSVGTTDYRHHDGSGGNPEGLYRGDGNGGWMKVSDSTVTIS